MAVPFVVAQVRTLLAPFVLRRLKSQVLQQLAPKTTEEVYLLPGPSQKALYDSILRRHIERQRARLASTSEGEGNPSQDNPQARATHLGWKRQGWKR